MFTRIRRTWAVLTGAETEQISVIVSNGERIAKAAEAIASSLGAIYNVLSRLENGQFARIIRLEEGRTTHDRRLALLEKRRKAKKGGRK